MSGGHGGGWRLLLNIRYLDMSSLITITAVTVSFSALSTAVKTLRQSPN